VSVPGDEHDGEDDAEHAHGVRCANPFKVKRRVWGVKKSGLYGWKMKMVVVDQKTPGERKTTLPSRVGDDQWKMTSMKTTPTEKLLGRGPGLDIYAAKLAEKRNPKNGPIVNFTTEQKNYGKKIHDTTARVSGQIDQIELTKPQQVYSSAIIQKPDEQECTSPFNQWEDSIGIRDGAVWPIRGRDQDFEMRTTSHCQK
jgi:hypothetical protein